MKADELKRRIKKQEDGLEAICYEWNWRMRTLIHYRGELKKLDDLVIFCQTGKYPE